MKKEASPESRSPVSIIANENSGSGWKRVRHVAVVVVGTGVLSVAYFGVIALVLSPLLGPMPDG